MVFGVLPAGSTMWFFTASTRQSSWGVIAIATLGGVVTLGAGGGVAACGEGVISLAAGLLRRLLRADLAAVAACFAVAIFVNS